MATQSRPLMNKGVALASAAAIAAATPAIMPTLDVPTHALATAEVQLANFADVMSVPPGVWSDILFGNTSWGDILSEDVYGPEWAAPQTEFLQAGYVNPWALYCGGSGTCNATGISGVAYLFFDALVNGDGSGFENSDTWKVGFVNYLFEPAAVFQIGGGSSPGLQFVSAGLSAATWYALQGTIGQAFPELTVPIASFFYGTLNVSVAYNLVGVLIAQALSVVPLIGPFLGNSVLAYLGDLENPSTPGTPYQFGLSGTLNYWVDILSGAAPFPTAEAVPAEAATALASATASATSAALKSDIAQATEAAAPEASPAVEVAEASPAVEVAPVEVAPVEVAPVEVAEATPAVEVAPVEVADAGPVAEAPESVATSAADLPAVEVADIAAVKAPKRPVRSAVERAAKSVRSALGATKADTAGSNTVSPGRATGSAGPGSPAGSVGSGSTAAESASSDAGSASSDAGSASSDAGSSGSEG